MVQTIGEIVNQVIQAHKEGKTINLSKIKAEISKANGLNRQPKTIDIIAAIPEQYKKELLPKIKAKPVRTASGVCNIFFR
jgi:elongator complex protein 3